MTAAKCAENCAGYSYFATASECNMACSGNSAERCGSGMRLNVYEFDSTSSTDMTPTPGSSAPAATILGYAYQGCFTDNVPQRVLAGKTSADEAMTLEMCAAFCKVGGYSWFGLEYGRECYCGTKLDALSTKELESACDTTCSGNTFQKCGGPNHLNVYTNPTLSAPTEKSVTSLNGFRYKSCWTDKVDDRSLKAVDYRTDDMTVEKCADKCKGYAYFGLEYSRECFCGDNLSGKAAPESDCGMLCMGANKQWCGGPDRLNLYTQATDDSQFTSSSRQYFHQRYIGIVFLFSNFGYPNVPSPTPTPGIGDDLLGDGGFETGGLNNWSVKNYYGMELVNLRVDSSRPRTGNYAMAMNFKNENGLSIDFKRSMKVIPGRTYQIQAYYYATNPSTSACNLLVGADITYNQDSGFVGYPANAWLAKSLTFKATKSWYTLRFVFTCNVSEDKSGKTDVWFDDWTFKRLD
ncbi:hypothetical protein N0V86_008481 [Didymella sp. IMI 355093]|nr:hypothetical protein N0V86_008481 [Didymella sp. IMI 355093]